MITVLWCLIQSLSRPSSRLVNSDGKVIFGPAWFDFIADDVDPPDMVNPSLCRQSQAMKRGGLFKMVNGLYQWRKRRRQAIHGRAKADGGR